MVFMNCIDTAVSILTGVKLLVSKPTIQLDEFSNAVAYGSNALLSAS